MAGRKPVPSSMWRRSRYFTPALAVSLLLGTDAALAAPPTGLPTDVAYTPVQPGDALLHPRQPGDRPRTNRYRPVTVIEAGVSAVSAGVVDSCAIVSGALQCWGSNFYGQLGDRTTTNS